MSTFFWPPLGAFPSIRAGWRHDVERSLQARSEDINMAVGIASGFRRAASYRPASPSAAACATSLRPLRSYAATLLRCYTAPPLPLPRQVMRADLVPNGYGARQILGRELVWPLAVWCKRVSVESLPPRLRLTVLLAKEQAVCGVDAAAARRQPGLLLYAAQDSRSPHVPVAILRAHCQLQPLLHRLADSRLHSHASHKECLSSHESA